MNKVLIIYFNDQLIVKSDEKANFLKIITELAKGNSIAVANIDEFSTLLSYLPGDQQIYVFIHIMSSYLAENIHADFPGKTWAISLQNSFPNCNYIFVTSDNSKNSIKIFDNKEAFNINDLMHRLFVKKNFSTSPQLVSSVIEKHSTISHSNDYKSHLIDFAIITALYDHEFEAVKTIFELKEDNESELGGKSVYIGSLNSHPSKKVLAIYQTNSGMIDASAIASELIKEFKPRYIFMTGVCGGSSKLAFGDVVIAKFVFTFNKGKISDEGFLRELEFVKMNERAIRKITENNIHIIRKVKSELVSNSLYDKFNKFQFQNFHAHIEPMACSNFVINQENYFQEVIKVIERKAAAVEMESYGIARAAESTNSGNTKCIIIKGVMDNTTNKTDEAKPFASYTSALYLKYLLENDILE